MIFLDRDSGGKIGKFLYQLFVIFFSFSHSSFAQSNDTSTQIPILCYHRFATQINDEMTVKTADFVKQLAWLKENGYTVISLDTAAQYLKGERGNIPDKPVVITVDDGHKSVYFEMLPVVKYYKVPVTLFIYPSAISNARYALTWEQLHELEETELFHVESHTYWHPNFKKDKKRLSAEAYDQFVTMQLGESKHILEAKMGHEIKYLAWAFGIYDEELQRKAKEAGYKAAFTIERKHADRNQPIMALPRYMILHPATVDLLKRVLK
ncbi:MAG: polysaccharide deacetylase family protein [Campylobacterales bacterium]|nr:polysaccharide deacetylase family protein [Campylobacterales bacterium]HEO98657.1 polysaccharide deacetylase family protein [Campylobacterota bacterium]